MKRRNDSDLNRELVKKRNELIVEYYIIFIFKFNSYIDSILDENTRWKNIPIYGKNYDLLVEDYGNHINSIENLRLDHMIIIRDNKDLVELLFCICRSICLKYINVIGALDIMKSIFTYYNFRRLGDDYFDNVSDDVHQKCLEIMNNTTFNHFNIMNEIRHFNLDDLEWNPSPVPGVILFRRNEGKYSDI